MVNIFGGGSHNYAFEGISACVIGGKVILEISSVSDTDSSTSEIFVIGFGFGLVEAMKEHKEETVEFAMNSVRVITLPLGPMAILCLTKNDDPEDDDYEKITNMELFLVQVSEFSPDIYRVTESAIISSMLFMMMKKNEHIYVLRITAKNGDLIKGSDTTMLNERIIEIKDLESHDVDKNFLIMDTLGFTTICEDYLREECPRLKTSSDSILHLYH